MTIVIQDDIFILVTTITAFVAGIVYGYPIWRTRFRHRAWDIMKQEDIRVIETIDKRIKTHVIDAMKEDFDLFIEELKRI